MKPTKNAFIALFALASYALAQPAPPAANAGGPPQGPGRGGLAPVVIGPAAPVPPEVAIPRPTPEELTRVNDALTAWIASDKSQVKPLLEKFQPLMLLQPPRANNAATYTQTQQRQGARHLGFAEIASKGDIDLLLHGDSITDWWVQGDANKAVFDKYFGNIKTANFAVAGDTTQGVLWGLKNGEGQGFQPKAVMLMIGTNNTGASTAPEIAEGVGAVVLEMRKDFPNAKILLLAIFPRGIPSDPVRDAAVTTSHRFEPGIATSWPHTVKPSHPESPGCGFLFGGAGGIGGGDHSEWSFPRATRVATYAGSASDIASICFAAAAMSSCRTCLSSVKS